MLQHGRVAGHEGRSSETNDLPEGEVPRHDREDHAEWLERHKAPPRVRLDRLIREVLDRVLRVMVATHRALLYLSASLGDRLSHLLRDQPRVAVRALAQELGEPPHAAAALGDGPAAPGLERVLGVGHGRRDLLGRERLE